jgi:hypothetical protein
MSRTAGGAWLEVTAEGGQRGWLPADGLQDLRVAEGEAWEKVNDSRDPGALLGFLRRFPDGAFAKDAKEALAALRRQERQAAETVEARLERALAASYGPADADRIADLARDLPAPQRLYFFGRLHETGNGVLRNAQLARRYYSFAAELGYAPAATELVRLDASPALAPRPPDPPPESKPAASAPGEPAPPHETAGHGIAFAAPPPAPPTLVSAGSDGGSRQCRRVAATGPDALGRPRTGERLVCLRADGGWEVVADLPSE